MYLRAALVRPARHQQPHDDLQAYWRRTLLWWPWRCKQFWTVAQPLSLRLWRTEGRLFGNILLHRRHCRIRAIPSGCVLKALGELLLPFAHYVYVKHPDGFFSNAVMQELSGCVAGLWPSSWTSAGMQLHRSWSPRADLGLHLSALPCLLAMSLMLRLCSGHHRFVAKDSRMSHGSGSYDTCSKNVRPQLRLLLAQRRRCRIPSELQLGKKQTVQKS